MRRGEVTTLDGGGGEKMMGHNGIEVMKDGGKMNNGERRIGGAMMNAEERLKNQGEGGMLI